MILDIYNHQNKNIDPEEIIALFVRNVVFYLVLDLPRDGSWTLPKIETGAAARNRVIEAIIGESSWLMKKMASYFTTGEKPDIEGTNQFIQSIMRLNPPPSMVIAMREKGMDEEVIQCHIATVLQAGTDTSFFALKIALILLAKNPSLQEDIYEQVKNLGETFTYSELMEACPLVRSFVFHSLTAYTPIPLLRGRVDTQHWTEIDNLQFPPSTIFSISADETHKRNSWRDDYEKYNLSFSDGRRACPGKTLAITELTMAIASIVQSFKIHDVTNDDDLNKYIRSLVTRYFIKPYELKFEMIN